MSNFHPLEVVCRYRDTQLQVGENLNKLPQLDKSYTLVIQYCDPQYTSVPIYNDQHFFLSPLQVHSSVQLLVSGPL